MGRTRAVLIVNPTSAGGATARRMELLRELAGRHFAEWELWETEGPMHATVLAAQAIDDGWPCIVCVGGDGTAHEVVNGYFREDGSQRGDPLLAMVPAGTGSDLVRTLRIPAPWEAAVALAGSGATTRADVGWVTLTSPDGASVGQAFINVAGFGANGDVVRLANRGSKRFGGMPTFLGATLRTIARYRAEVVDVTWTDESGEPGAWQGELLAAFVANGRNVGGGMLVGPDALLEDGVFDLTIVPKLPVPKLARHLPKVYTGGLGRVPEVICARIRELRVEPIASTATVRIDLDGECPGTCPMSIQVLSGVLPMRVGADYSGYSSPP